MGASGAGATGGTPASGHNGAHAGEVNTIGTGGGGGGYYGGGSGGGQWGNDYCGGGGGSGYVTGTNTQLLSGSGTIPPMTSDSDYAGNAGHGGGRKANGTNGRVVLEFLP